MSTQPQINKLKIANPALTGNARTYLTQDVDAGDTLLDIMAKNGFTLAERLSNFYIIIGDYGDETAEIKLVTANNTANKQLAIGALLNSHSASDPVTFINYNKAQIFGATDSGGDKTLITTVDIDPTQQYTEFQFEGAVYNFFSTAYYNSTENEISSYSEEVENASFTRRSAKRIIESAARKALTAIDEAPTSKLNWDIGLTVLQDGIDEILSKKRKWPFLRSTYSNSTTKDVDNLAFARDLSELEFVKVDGVSAEYISPLRYNQLTGAGTIQKGKPAGYTIKNNAIYFFPVPDQAYTVIQEYYKVPAVVDALSTQIDLPFVVALVYYCASQFAYIRGNDKRGDKMFALFNNIIEAQRVQYSGPSQSGDAESIEQTNHYSDDIDFI